MNALEKIRFLKDYKVKHGCKGPYFLDISVEENRWQPDEVKNFFKVCPYLPDLYYQLITEFDSLGLGWVTFFGSKDNDILPLQEEVEYWSPLSKREYFPFAKDADGSIYAFNKKAEIIYFDIDDYKWETPQLIAKSLEEFVSACILGRRFGEFNNLETSKFYPFLRAQGWA